MLEPDVGDVGTPHLVHVRDLHAPKQVGILTVHRIGHGRAGPRMDGAEAHLAHERADEITPRLDSVGLPQFGQYLTLPRCRVVRVDFVHVVHDLDLAFGHRRYVVDSAAGDAQQLALLRDRVFGVLAFHHVLPYRSPNFLKFFFRNSISRSFLPISVLASSMSFSSSSMRCFSFLGPPKTTAAFLISSCFHWLIMLACTPNSAESSPRVLSSLMAARATFALNASSSTLRVRLDVSEMLSRLLAGFISLLFILVPLDVEFSFFSTKEPRFYRLKISDRLCPKNDIFFMYI